jgi:hypothetical protein
MAVPATIEGIGSTALLQAMDENLWAFWRDYGRAPGAELHERRAALLQRLPMAASDRDREQDQAAVWNSSAMKLAWARVSRPPTPRTCPFLTIAIAS